MDFSFRVNLDDEQVVLDEVTLCNESSKGGMEGDEEWAGFVELKSFGVEGAVLVYISDLECFHYFLSDFVHTSETRKIKTLLWKVCGFTWRNHHEIARNDGYRK